jgi:hypothetical protein
MGELSRCHGAWCVTLVLHSTVWNPHHASRWLEETPRALLLDLASGLGTYVAFFKSL